MQIKGAMRDTPRSFAALQSLAEEVVYKHLPRLYYVQVTSDPRFFVLEDNAHNRWKVNTEAIGSIQYYSHRIALSTGHKFLKRAAVEAVLLHEVAHALHEHEGDVFEGHDRQEFHDHEYEADRWAFTQLHKQYDGIIPPEACTYFLNHLDHWNFYNDGQTHPAIEDRLEHLEELGLIEHYRTIAMLLEVDV